MSNNTLTKKEIKCKKNSYCNISLVVGAFSAVGIILSPTIIFTAISTLVGAGTGYYFLRKIKELNEVEKKL